MKTITLILICFTVQHTKALDPNATQPPLAPVNVDKTVLEAYEHAQLETEILSGKTINHAIEFTLEPNQNGHDGILTLKTFINLDELDVASEKTTEEKNSLRAFLLNLFREKLQNEETQTIKLSDKKVLIVGKSPRFYRYLGEKTQCHVTVADNYYDCLECKLFIDSMRYQQLKGISQDQKAQVSKQ